MWCRSSTHSTGGEGGGGKEAKGSEGGREWVKSVGEGQSVFFPSLLNVNILVSLNIINIL